MKNSYDRSVSLLCPTGASEEVSCLDELRMDESTYQCKACDERFSYAEIRDANSERIEAAVEEMKTEVFSDIRKDFSKMFKKI